MDGNTHFAVIVGYLFIAIVLLLWAMLCGVVAERIEKEGLAFRTGFVICAMFTPIAGIVAAKILTAQRSAARPAPVIRSLES
jgi:hypothetical protein